MAYQTTFRPAAWIYAVAAAGDLIATLGAIVIYVQEGDTWLIVALVLLSVAFNVGFVDLAVSRIDLLDDELRITELFSRRSVRKADIASEKVEGGAVFLQLQSGEWFKLPSTGHNSLGVLNSAQAWIRDRTR